MKNFAQGVAVGIVIGYVFYADIDKIVRRGLDKANEVVEEQPKPSTPGDTSTGGFAS